MFDSIEIIASLLLVISIIHTFCIPFFFRLSQTNNTYSKMFYLLSEVEVIFGLWALILMIFMVFLEGLSDAIFYIKSCNFTEPLFVFVIMIVAASRPIYQFVTVLIRWIIQILPLNKDLTEFFIIISFIPLSGSLITEPAAMTLAAFFLRDSFFFRNSQLFFKYLVVGVLFVNVSIGGILTAYAAPPILMVASTFKWNTNFIIMNFGWRAVLVVIFNTVVLTILCYLNFNKNIIKSNDTILYENQIKSEIQHNLIPLSVILVHISFLTLIVLNSHNPVLIISLFILFIVFTKIYKKYQDPLIIRQSFMVYIFLSGLIILGGLQKWWLQGLIGKLEPLFLFFWAILITSIIDNAALTYLGSLVEGTNNIWKYMLVSGAVTGGGLTVIANAPNPAGFSILKSHFPNGNISIRGLLLSALYPTLVATLVFLYRI